ncbi:LysE family translocator [Saccharopolyspora griseoalba]|uniref:LysE family translocator n=1 Tax=Saccharopolyspora griseoalba TaxID=1431848 RepID=A0ABW2LV15_9PSEU
MHIAWGSFLLALLVIVLVPGPDFVMVTRSAASGRRYGWLAAAGIVCGLCLHATAASLGLSALVVAVPTALFVVKALGVAYLVWMGFQVLRKSGSAPVAGGAPAGPVSGRGVFVRALLTDLLNPKVMLTFLTLLPQAMDPAAAPMPQAALLSGVAVGAFAGWWLVVVPSVGKLAEWLASPRRKKVFERVCGSALIAMATSIAVG